MTPGVEQSDLLHKRKRQMKSLQTGQNAGSQSVANQVSTLIVFQASFCPNHEKYRRERGEGGGGGGGVEKKKRPKALLNSCSLSVIDEEIIHVPGRNNILTFVTAQLWHLQFFLPFLYN